MRRDSNSQSREPDRGMAGAVKLGLVLSVFLATMASLVLLSTQMDFRVDTELLLPNKAQQSSAAVIGDAIVDGDLKKAFSRPPRSYKAVARELRGYALDTGRIREEAKGLAPTDAAQKKASEELKSYHVLNFDENKRQPHASVRHGEGSAYEGRHESKELNSYKNILDFAEPKAHEPHKLDSHMKKTTSAVELDSYNNILSFPSPRAHAAKKHQTSVPDRSKVMTANINTIQSKSAKTSAVGAKMVKYVKVSAPKAPTKAKLVEMVGKAKHIPPLPASNSDSAPKASTKASRAGGQTTKLLEVFPESELSASDGKALNPEMPLASEWMDLWQETKSIESKGSSADKKQAEQVKKSLAEVKHAIIKESYDPAETQRYDAAFLKKDLEGIDTELGEIDSHFVKAEQQAKEDVKNCQICLDKWSPTALPCALKACRQPTSSDDDEQLKINNDIAAAFQGCIGARSPDTAAIRVVAKDFVRPWEAPDGSRLHAWVETARASPGLLGLGLQSGQSPRLEMGHAVYVSAAATRCHGAPETLEQLLAPLAARQRDLNRRRIKEHDSRAPAGRQSLAGALADGRPASRDDGPAAAVLAWRAAKRGAEPSMLRRTAVAADPWQDFLRAEASADGAQPAPASGAPALAREDGSALEGAPVLATARAQETPPRAAPPQVGPPASIRSAGLGTRPWPGLLGGRE
jgi:hypothetical protein